MVPCSLRAQPYLKSNYRLDEETLRTLERKEQWHFSILQLGWFTIGVFLTSLFELLIFTIGGLSSDFPERIEVFGDTVSNGIYWLQVHFGFGCQTERGFPTRWQTELTSYTMTLFKLHFIVIMMYTTLFIIVLFKIPYKYDRLQKTPKEQKAERKRRAKKRSRKLKRRKKDGDILN